MSVTWTYDHADSQWRVRVHAPHAALDVVVGDGEVLVRAGSRRGSTWPKCVAHAVEQADRLFSRV